MSPRKYHPRSSTRGSKHWSNCLFPIRKKYFRRQVCENTPKRLFAKAEDVQNPVQNSKFQLPAMFWLVYFPAKMMEAERNIQWDCDRLSFLLPVPSPLLSPKPKKACLRRLEVVRIAIRIELRWDTFAFVFEACHYRDTFLLPTQWITYVFSLSLWSCVHFPRRVTCLKSAV